jgi:polyisoprenoid-binding protein YceI
MTNPCRLSRWLKKFAANAVVLTSLLLANSPLQAASYAIDPTHTFATFEIDHFETSTNRGRFDKKEGTLAFDRVAKTGKIVIDIFTGSVNSGTIFFDKFLTGFTMFDSATFPTARFEADQFKFNDDKVTEVAGNFTLLGKNVNNARFFHSFILNETYNFTELFCTHRHLHCIRSIIL